MRRQNEVYLDALGAQRIPDPTTAGDFCRRFKTEASIEALMMAVNETRLRGWRRQPTAFFREAMIDADGTLAETTTRIQNGTTTRRTGRLAGTRFSTCQPPHRASRRLETRLFWG